MKKLKSDSIKYLSDTHYMKHALKYLVGAKFSMYVYQDSQSFLILDVKEVESSLFDRKITIVCFCFDDGKSYDVTFNDYEYINLFNKIVKDMKKGDVSIYA